MANVLGELFSDIAGAIREKTGDVATMKPALFPEKIRGISSGGGGSSTDVRYVTFMNDDGTVELGKKAVAVGDDCADPIARGIFGTPTKESTAQYTYTFSGGWATTPGGGKDSNALKAVTEDRTVYANFISAVRYYTITFYDSDGTTVLKTSSLAYGATPSYNPTKGDYIFTGWSPALSVVTGNASYTASWIESVDFATASWETIAARSADGSASKLWKVGDTKNITYTDSTGTVRTNPVKIVAFNHDETKDGAKVGITLILSGSQWSDKLNDKSVTYEDMSGYYAGGWSNCNMRTILNRTVFNSLDSGLRSAIKEVKKVSDYSVKKTASDTDYIRQITTYDKIWIPSLGELGLSYGSGLTKVGNDGPKYPNIDPKSFDISINWNYWTRTGNGASWSSNVVSIMKTSSSAKPGNVTAISPNYVIFGFCI